MTGSIGTINLITNTSGFENRYFLNNPDITFFKSVYRKHTNFCKYLDMKEKEPINLSNSSTSIIEEIKDTGDLLSKIYLENKIIFTKKPNVPAPTTGLTIFANLGSNILTSNDDDSLSIDIGTNRAVFKSSGLFQEIKGELSNQMSLTTEGNSLHDGATTTTNQIRTLAPHLDIDKSSNTIIISCKNGSHYNYTTLSGGVRGIDIPQEDLENKDLETEFFYTIPEFSFMKDYGLALPLLSLRNDKITFNLKFNSISTLCKLNNGEISNIYTCQLKYNIIKELIHLDTDEKRRFLTSQLTYLTEHIKTSKINQSSQDVSSAFTLSKYLLLVGNPKESTNEYSVSQSITTPTNLKFNKLNIRISGNPLYTGSSNLNKEIFTKININKYFSGNGRDLSINSTKGVVSGSVDGSAFNLNDANTMIQDNMIITGGTTKYTVDTTSSSSSGNTIINTVGVPGGISNDTNLTFSLEDPKNYGLLDSIAMIPFAIDPLNYTQPSGCISNSGSSNKILLETEYESDSISPNMRLYSINYNILQISDGKVQVYSS